MGAGGRKRQTKLKVMQESGIIARSIVKEVLEGTNQLISLLMVKDEDSWLVEELDKYEEQMRKKLELEPRKREVETSGRGMKRKLVVKLQPPAPAKKPKVEKKKIGKIATTKNPIKNLWEKLKKKQSFKDSEKSLLPGCAAVGVECGRYSDNVLRGETKQISFDNLGLIALNDSKGESSNLRSDSS